MTSGVAGSSGRRKPRLGLAHHRVHDVARRARVRDSWSRRPRRRRGPNAPGRRTTPTVTLQRARIDRRRGRDRVIARRQRRAAFRGTPRTAARRPGTAPADRTPIALRQHLGAVGALVLARQRQQLRLRHGATRVRRESSAICLRVATCWSSTIVGQQRVDRDRCRRPAAAAAGPRRRVSRTIASASKPKRAQRALHQSRAVARRDAEVVAGAVGHALPASCSSTWRVERLRRFAAATLCSSRFSHHPHRHRTARGDERHVVCGGVRSRRCRAARVAFAVVSAPSEVARRPAATALANQSSNWPSRSSRASPSPRAMHACRAERGQRVRRCSAARTGRSPPNRCCRSRRPRSARREASARASPPSQLTNCAALSGGAPLYDAQKMSDRRLRSAAPA